MELKEGDYILGYWFANDKDNNSWYEIIIKRNGKWEGQYTFRYNKEEDEDCDPFSGKDEKSIYRIKFKEDVPEKKIIEDQNKVFEIIKLKFNNYSDWFLVQGNIDKFMETAKTKEYLHFKMENLTNENI